MAEPDLTHVRQLVPDPENRRRHNPRNLGMVVDALQAVGAARSIVVDEDGVVLAGNGVTEAAMEAGITRVQVVDVDGSTLVAVRRRGLTAEQKRALALWDNRTAELAEWDADQLRLDAAQGLDLAPWFSDAELAAVLGTQAPAPTTGPTLADRFLVPPFSVLNAREGWWQARKAAWLALGIQSELGRGNLNLQQTHPAGTGTIDFYARKRGLEQVEGPLTYDQAKARIAAQGALQDPRALAKSRKQRGRAYSEDLMRGEKARPYVAPQRPRPNTSASPNAMELVGGYAGHAAGTAGVSIFDPVLCELVTRWFCPPGGLVLDPFAGGSVRGVVAAWLGRRYVGVDLSDEQLAANRSQWLAISQGLGPGTTDDPDALTPVQWIAGVAVKRDDLFQYGGVRGGKVRSCLTLARAAQASGVTGLVTAGSRSSPQVNIVAQVGRALGLQTRGHTPSGPLSPEVQAAQAAGMDVTQHGAGYNSVIVRRALDDGAARGWAVIPFGMECPTAVDQTRRQVANLPADVQRIVVAAGSGMTLAGILWGLADLQRDVPVLAVVVGADPTARLDEYAPRDWRTRVTLQSSGTDYATPAPDTILGTIALDPIYEAKCLPWLQPGDLFWITGIRQTAQAAPPARVAVADAEGSAPSWIAGDSRDALPDVQADLVFTCPPYADLEVYSDNPRDISTLPYADFLAAYRAIVAAAVARLRPDRFAAVVVGDVRDPQGHYRGFVADTIRAFTDAGAALYNDAVLVTAVGSLPVRAGQYFVKTRKLGKTHQNVLVFIKGDPRRATAAIGPVDCGTGTEDHAGAQAEADGAETV